VNIPSPAQDKLSCEGMNGNGLVGCVSSVGERSKALVQSRGRHEGIPRVNKQGMSALLLKRIRFLAG